MWIIFLKLCNFGFVCKLHLVHFAANILNFTQHLFQNLIVDQSLMLVVLLALVIQLQELYLVLSADVLRMLNVTLS